MGRKKILGFYRITHVGGEEAAQGCRHILTGSERAALWSHILLYRSRWLRYDQTCGPPKASSPPPVMDPQPGPNDLAPFSFLCIQEFFTSAGYLGLADNAAALQWMEVLSFSIDQRCSIPGPLVLNPTPNRIALIMNSRAPRDGLYHGCGRKAALHEYWSSMNTGTVLLLWYSVFFKSIG